LFSGIAGFSIGLERAGMETVAFCEIEKYPQKVLAKHWPNIPIYEDVRNVTKERLDADGIYPDIVCGGFPCQDLSVAGNQKGITAERSGLWGELCRIIGEVRPKYAIVENVTALISGDRGRWFGRVLGDLAEIGYDCEWHCISASELGAHHHRDRVWIICYPQHTRWDASEIREGNQARNGSDSEGSKPAGESAGPGNAEKLANTKCLGRKAVDNKEGNNSKTKEGLRVKPATRSGIENDVADPISKRQQRQGEYVKPLFAEAIKNWQAINAESGRISGVWSTEPELGRVANGVPDRTHRLKGLGNAVVPQIPELIGRAIIEVENERFNDS